MKIPYLYYILNISCAHSNMYLVLETSEHITFSNHLLSNSTVQCHTMLEEKRNKQYRARSEIWRMISGKLYSC